MFVSKYWVIYIRPKDTRGYINYNTNNKAKPVQHREHFHPLTNGEQIFKKVSPKRRYLPTSLHGDRTQNDNTAILTAARTSKSHRLLIRFVYTAK